MSGTPPSLRELQLTLARAITGSEPELERWVRPAPPLDARARIEIYEGGWFHRLEQSLRDDFPALAAALGEEEFTEVLAGYLEECPPRSPSLLDEGARLPEFLARHPMGERPWLVELARLERACLEARFAAEAGGDGLRALSELPPGEWESYRLRLGPSVRLLRSEWEIEPLWRAKGLGEPRQRPCELLVYRDVYTVRVEDLRARPLEAAALTALEEEGLGLGTLLERFASPGIAGWLLAWASRGIVQGRS